MATNWCAHSSRRAWWRTSTRTLYDAFWLRISGSSGAIIEWLRRKRPRDTVFSATVAELIDLYTRPLQADALVRYLRCADLPAAEAPTVPDPASPAPPPA